MKTYLFPILAIIALLSGCNRDNSTDPRLDQLAQQRGYANWYLDNFRCGVFVPPSYTPEKDYPLIIFLHGHTDTTTWDLPWYNEPIVSDDPCIVLTPKCPVEEIYGWGDSWNPRTSPMMQKTWDMLGLVEQGLSLDYDRFYIYGSSMGGYGTYGAIQKHPDIFAAAYVECGAGNPEMADILAEIPFWIFHGSEDPVVSVSYARDMYHAVLDAGGTQIRYTEYPGVGHNAWDYTGHETTLNSWLLAQRKGYEHGTPDGLGNILLTLDERNHVHLSWEFFSDPLIEDNQPWYVRIYRDGEMLKEIYNDQLSFVDSAVTSGNMYNYELSVVSYFFKESPLTSVHTPPIP
jgi:pimeloyl-ACP methyl ester carboxylesterase